MYKIYITQNGKDTFRDPDRITKKVLKYTNTLTDAVKFRKKYTVEHFVNPGNEYKEGNEYYIRDICSYGKVIIIKKIKNNFINNIKKIIK